jgi:hypothetical protein
MGLGAILAVTLMVSLAQAGPFPPGPADDMTTSLGSFRVYIQPAFRGLFAGYPGYNAATARLQSPTLFDSSTIIGRSAVHTHGSLPDINGTPVGTAGTMISDTSFLLVPAGFQGPPLTEEVHTKVHKLNMLDFAGFGARVRAGTAAPGRPISPGEVESKNATPPGGFPAESFFDVFVEVDIPALGGTTATIYNIIPLLVANSNLTDPPGFPPRVVYTHGNSTAVPVYFLVGNPGFWNAGDLLGWLVLAGHGVSYGTSDVAEFEEHMATVPEMPLPPNVPTVNEWGLIVLTALLLGAAVVIFRRRRVRPLAGV